MMWQGERMKPQSSFMEIRKRGNLDDCFETYSIVRHRSELFVTNHWHTETEILFVTDGCIHITINDTTYVGQSGDVFVINSGEMHEIRGVSTSLAYTAFVFDFEILSFRKHDFAQQQFIEPILRNEIRFSNNLTVSDKALHILHNIRDINTQKKDCYMLCTKAGLLQFFALLVEEKQIVSASSSPLGSEKTQLLKNIVAYIHTHYAQKIVLTDIAEQFHMSHKYFCRFFKKHFNQTLVEYANDVRIENAVALLDKQHVSITQAALSCGFANMSYFSHVFKKKMGCTPTEYKQRDGL